ncbi:MAG: lysophospholipase [Alphaproteobacteria bacterium]
MAQTFLHRLAPALICATLASACAPVIRPAGPPVTEPRIEGGKIIAADGASLPLRRWPPEGRVRAVILALHGFNDYSNAFDAAASYWAKGGIITYAFDQRGFGDAPHRGLWAGAKTMIDDTATAVGLLRRAHPDAPLYLLGDSMGGAVAMLALAARSRLADGAVLVAPAVWGRRHMNPFQTAALWLLARTVPWLTLTGKGLEIKPSDNIAMLRALGRDPKVIKGARVDTIKGLVDLMDAAHEAAPRLRGPVLVMYGGRDEIVPKEPSLEVLATLREKAGARAMVYDGGYHMLLRDLAAETAWKDIAAWIDDTGAQLPSGAEAGSLSGSVVTKEPRHNSE